MAKYNLLIREEELKNKVAADYFGQYDTTQIVGNIDFSVALPMPNDALDLFDADFFLWGEAKKGDKQDIDDSLVQLLITIIKAKTFNSYLPPLYLAAFDAEKIAFLPYDTDLQKQILFDEHLENTIDWKSVTPSDHHAAVFLKIKEHAAPLLDKKILFDYEKDEKDLRRFIRDNFKAQKQGTNKINITLNRMTAVFNRWLEIVKPTIKIDWANLAKENIVPADFFLADALSKNNWSLGETLKVLLRTDFYMMNLKVKVGDAVMDTFTNVQFTDNQKAHQAFWNRYNRPPSAREREKMQVRRDLLIEPDRRERKGAFFTPHQWVELSQEYLAQTLGENWQEEYYVWDCCAGTGNLLYGLTEKERIFASTLDDADVRFMQQQDFLLPKHVFQFDFLNDDLQDADKVPADLRRILADPELRKKLVIYINPPYAEAGTATQVTGSGANKTGVSNNTKIWQQYKYRFGLGIRELYVQFLIRIYAEIHGSTLAEFSKLKILQGSAFADFRDFFQARLLKSFAVPANTFDNVQGKFPIGFFIWDTLGTRSSSPAHSESVQINSPAPLAGRGTKGAGNLCQNHYSDSIAIAKGYATFGDMDIYDHKGNFIGRKTLFKHEKEKPITNWIASYGVKETKDVIGYTGNTGPDFQHNQYLYIASKQGILKSGHPNNETKYSITKHNLIPISIYFSARLCQEATWLNDRDQFLYPNDGWKTDYEFQADCLVYTLFHGQNRISIGTQSSSPSSANDMRTGTSALQANHWIPFTEKEVGAQSLFASHFMSDYLAGKIGARSSSPASQEQDLFSQFNDNPAPYPLPASGAGKLITSDNNAIGAGECHSAHTNSPSKLEGAGGVCQTVELEKKVGSPLQNMSEQAKAVMDAGRALWRYYHQQPDAQADASYYDIRRYFQGTDAKGRMNPDSEDAEYMRLWDNLKAALRLLAAHIEPKVYEYGFLLGSNLQKEAVSEPSFD